MCNCPVQVDRQESAREQKRAEVLDSMKRLFPGVVSKFVINQYSMYRISSINIASSISTAVRY